MIKQIVDRIAGAGVEKRPPRHKGTPRSRAASKRLLAGNASAPLCNLRDVTDDALLLVAPLADEGARIFCNFDDEALCAAWDRKELSWMLCQVLFASTHFNLRLHSFAHPKTVSVSAGRMIANPDTVYLEIAHDGPTLRPSVLRAVNLSEGDELVDDTCPGLELLAVKYTLAKSGGTLLVQSPCPDFLSGVRYRLVFGRGTLAEAVQAAGG